MLCKGQESQFRSSPTPFLLALMDKDVLLFFFNDWVDRVEKQLAGTDSRGRKRKARNAKGKKTFCQPSKGSQHTNISLFDVSWGKKSA